MSSALALGTTNSTSTSASASSATTSNNNSLSASSTTTRTPTPTPKSVFYCPLRETSSEITGTGTAAAEVLVNDDLLRCIQETLGNNTWAKATEQHRITIVKYIYGQVNNWLSSSQISNDKSVTNVISKNPRLTKTVWHIGPATITDINCNHIPTELLTSKTKKVATPKQKLQASNPLSDPENDLEFTNLNPSSHIFCITVDLLEDQFQSLQFEFISESGVIIRFKFPPDPTTTTVKNDDYYIQVNRTNGEIRVYFEAVGLVLAFDNRIYENCRIQAIINVLKFFKLNVIMVDYDANPPPNKWQNENNEEDNSRQQIPPSMTASRLLEILRRFFARKEDGGTPGGSSGSGGGGKKRIHKMDISAPTNFVHVQHVGLDGTGKTPVLVVEPVNGNVEDPYDGNDNSNVGEREGQGLQLKMPSSQQTSGSKTNENYPEEEMSPTADKETMTFIYNVIEECSRESTLTATDKDKLRFRRNKKRQSSLASNRQTVQFPIMTDEQLSSILGAVAVTGTGTGTTLSSNGTQTQAQNIQTGITTVTDRDKLISDLQFVLENDEEAAELIVNFVETFKKERESLRSGPPSPAITTEPLRVPVTSASSAAAVAGANSNMNIEPERPIPRWTSGRTNAPPPPRPFTVSGIQPSFPSSSSNTYTGSSFDNNKKDFTKIRNSIQTELNQNLTMRNNSGRFSTLPIVRSASGSSEETISSVRSSLKKANSERRAGATATASPARRPNEPPPPPVPVQVREREQQRSIETKSEIFQRTDDNNDKATEPPSPSNKLPPGTSTGTGTTAGITSKPKPIPKPRTTKVQPQPAVRRLNSTPSTSTSEDIDRSMPIMQSSNSFDTATSYSTVGTEEREEEAPNEPPPPPPSVPSVDLTPRSAQKHQLVNELRAKFRQGRDDHEITTMTLSNENSVEEEEDEEDYNDEKKDTDHNQQDKHKDNQ